MDDSLVLDLKEVKLVDRDAVICPYLRCERCHAHEFSCIC